LVKQALEYILAELGECKVVVILANGKVYIVAHDAMLQHPEEESQKFINLAMHVVLPREGLSLRTQLLEVLHKLVEQCGRLLVDNKSVD